MRPYAVAYSQAALDTLSLLPGGDAWWRARQSNNYTVALLSAATIKWRTTLDVLGKLR